MENKLIESYFNTTEIEQRKKLMAQMDLDKDNIENYELIRKIYELRYNKRHGSKDKVQDYFIRGWVLLGGIRASSAALKNRQCQKAIKEVQECLGLDKYDAYSDLEKNILQKEYVNMTELYIDLALRDKSYGSTLFGIMRLSNEKIIEKLALEIYTLGFSIPKKTGHENAMKPLTMAMCQGFKNKCGNNYDLLQGFIDET